MPDDPAERAAPSRRARRQRRGRCLFARAGRLDPGRRYLFAAVITMRTVAAVAATVAAVLLIAGSWRGRTPLWKGAKFTAADHNRALRRGLFFLYAAGRQPDTFREWGHDLLSAFVNIAGTNADREISDLAWRMGHERAMEWRRLNHEVPATADADDLA